jgi:two-component system sensor histidine kinase/response regulator
MFETADIFLEKNLSLRRINILLVDDNLDNLSELENILKHERRNILKAKCTDEVLNIASIKDIALILIDMQMDEMSNGNLMYRLREEAKTKDIPVVFISSIGNVDKFINQGYEDGIVDYLFKPLEINTVNTKVRIFEKLYLQKMDLKQYAEKVEGINKQLDEFVYIVSHDLKAPLRGLASLATFLEDELGESPKIEVLDILSMMKSRTSRMQNLIDGILHYSRMANAKTENEDVNINELLNNIIDLICPPSNISMEIPDNLPVVHCEKIKLHEVFQNLISNAIKYNDKEKGIVKIIFEERIDSFEFSVQDNGTGIKPEHREKIFGIFQTLQPKDKIESTGIGLTIVKKIIEQQLGSINVQSEFGKGSTFKFTWKK